jgi:hypothetical protein
MGVHNYPYAYFGGWQYSGPAYVEAGLRAWISSVFEF